MILQNDFLKVEISNLGAEIKSIIDNNNSEWMWNANPSFWGKSSPILFPIIGSLKNNTFYYKEKAYQLPRHGFAREMVFESERMSEQKGIFILKSNQKTLENYPFHFTLQVVYELKANQLFCTYQVKNAGKETMYFSIGGHPAFVVGDVPADFEDYFLTFNNDSILNRLKLVDGLVSDDIETIELPNNQLPLNYTLFEKDALVFRDLKSNAIAIKNKKNNASLTLTFNDFTHFGIWTIPNANFICLEPWLGIADNINHNQKIEEKEGIISLKPSEAFTKNWSIAID